MRFIFCFLALFTTASASLAQAFRHPGIYQTASDMAKMKEAVQQGKEPYRQAFQQLKEVCDTHFLVQPHAHVMRGPYGRPNIGGEDLRRGAEMSYNYALAWYLSGDKRYAQKAIAIMDAWSSRLWDFDFNDAKLIAGLTGHTFCNAAEILRHSASGWTTQSQDAFRHMLMTAYYPVLRYYYPSANGNWNGAIIQSLMAIAIFTDNRSLFDDAVENFLHAPVNGSIFKYFYPSGQCQETTRDQGHVQLGIGQFAGAARIAYTQGVDLFSIADNRMALGFEYSASVLMGLRPHSYGVISERAMELRDDFEYVYRHYASKGLELPWTKKCADSIRKKSYRSVLTSIRHWGIPSKTKPLPKASDIGYVAGALAAATVVPPADAVAVEPGQSVQQALDKLSGKGGWVVLRSGIHTLPATLRIHSNTTLSGQGLGTIVFLDPSSGMRDAIVNAADSAQGITIRDLVVECSNRTDVPSDPNSNRSYRGGWNRGGIVFRANREYALRNIRLESITVRNATFEGVLISGVQGLQVVSCDFNENGSTVVPGPHLQHNLHLTRGRDIVVTGSRLDGSPQGSGVAIDHCINVLISNCEVARNGWDGILVTESRGISISGNLVEANDRNGLHVEFLHRGSENIRIEHNRIHYNHGKGLVAGSARQIAMNSNIMEGNGRSPGQTDIK